LDELQAHLTRRKLAVCKDDNGHGLMHRAVFLGHKDIVLWLLEKYPETAEVKDWVSKQRRKVKR
jgi:ankyrin repeat protein